MNKTDKVTVGIIGGKGKMGRLFADFFRRNGCKVLISDLDTKLTNTKLAARSDVIIVSVPIDATRNVIKKIVRYVRKDAVLMDLTSVKIKPVFEMLKCRGEVVGLHPMFPDTAPMTGQTVLLCPARGTKWLSWIKKLFKKEGVNMKTLTSREHDKKMAEAQSLVHFADIVFGDTLKTLKKPVRKVLEYTSASSDLKIGLAARLLAQDPNLYGNIQIENPNTEKTIAKYLRSAEKLLKIIKRKDLKAFTKYFNESKKFLGNYAKDAYDETDWIIAQLLKKRGLMGKKPEKLPKTGDIGVIGPRHTYSDIAAEFYYKNAGRAYFSSIGDVFDAVLAGRIKKGIVPIENLIHGTVRETLDELFRHDLKIIREINLPIHHCLISLDGSSPKDIKKIYSHSQAIQQCGILLKNHYKKAEIVSCSSTAFAIQKLIAKNDKSIGVIGSEEAAKAHNLKILKRNVEDSKNNKTTFIVIAKSPAEIKENEKTKTSIAFCFAKDKPGSLFLVFKDFAEAKINMTKIESRPAGKEMGEYIFFLDFEGNPKNSNVKNILGKVKNKTSELKILGTYLTA